MALRPTGPNIPSFERMQRARQSMASLGAGQGAGAPVAEFLRRIGQGMVDDAADSRAADVSSQAAAKGALDGAAAAAGMTAPTLIRGDTIHDRAYDQAQLAAYQARLDISLTEQGDQLARDHATDVMGFSQKWDSMAQGLLSQMPDDLKPSISVVLDHRKQQHIQPIRKAELARDMDAANADLISAQQMSMDRAANAWRRGQVDDAGIYDQSYLTYLNSRTDLDERHKVVERQKYQMDMRRHAVLGHFDQAKRQGLDAAQGFIRDFTAPGSHSDLSPDFVDRLGTEMTRDLSVLKADHQLAVADLRGQASTALDLAAKGYAVPQLDDLISRAQRIDPSLAKALISGRDDIRYQAEVSTLPPSEIAARAADWKSKADAETDLATKDKYARRHQVSIESLQKNLKAINDDPVLHAMRQGLIPDQAMDVSAPKPKDLMARIQARDRAKIVYGLNDMPLLTSSEATNLVRGVSAAAPEKMADAMQTLAQTYGSAWPDVYGQMVKAKLPAEYRIMATIDNPVARVRLAEAMALGKEPLSKSLPSSDVTNINKDVDSGLTALRSSLSHTPDGARIVSEYSEAAKILAYRYAQILPWDEASAKAMQDLITSKYDFVQTDSINARVPFGTGDAIRSMASRQLMQLKPDDVMAVTDTGHGLDENTRRRAAWNAAKRGTWFTNERDDGWVLLDVAGNPVLRTDGSRVEFRYTAAGVVK